jgi:hypothetical protein
LLLLEEMVCDRRAHVPRAADDDVHELTPRCRQGRKLASNAGRICRKRPTVPGRHPAGGYRHPDDRVARRRAAVQVAPGRSATSA